MLVEEKRACFRLGASQVIALLVIREQKTNVASLCLISQIEFYAHSRMEVILNNT